MKFKIGISGKRFIASSERDAIKARLKVAIENCLQKNGIQQFTGISSLAIGADTIFAELVLNDFKQELEVVLPFSVDKYEKDFAGDDLTVFRSLIARASKVDIVNKREISGNAQRNQDYFDAGKGVATTADQMIFVIDELKPAGKGGTADVLGFYAHHKSVGQQAIILPTIAKAQDDVQVLLLEEYRKANENALQARDRYRISWKLSLFIAWLGVTLFALSTGFEIHGAFGWWLSCLEFVSIGGLLLYLYFAKVKNFHGLYVKERIRAEQFRLMNSFYQADTEIVLSDLGTEEKNVTTDLILKANQMVEKRNYYSPYYSDYAINNLINEQRGYHMGKIREVGHKSEWFEALNLWIGRLFFVNILVHFLSQSMSLFFDQHVPEVLHHLTVFLSIFLPASYASLEGMMYFRGWEQTKKHSAQVLQRIESCAKTMPNDFSEENAQQVKEQQARCLNAMASVMLSDNQSWRNILEDKASYHWIV